MRPYVVALLAQDGRVPHSILVVYIPAMEEDTLVVGHILVVDTLEAAFAVLQIRVVAAHADHSLFHALLLVVQMAAAGEHTPSSHHSEFVVGSDCFPFSFPPKAVFLG